MEFSHLHSRYSLIIAQVEIPFDILLHSCWGDEKKQLFFLLKMWKRAKIKNNNTPFTILVKWVDFYQEFVSSCDINLVKLPPRKTSQLIRDQNSITTRYEIFHHEILFPFIISLTPIRSFVDPDKVALFKLSTRSLCDSIKEFSLSSKFNLTFSSCEINFLFSWLSNPYTSHSIASNSKDERNENEKLN